MSAAAPAAADGEGAAEGGAGAGTAGLDDDSTGRAATLSKLNSNESTGSGSNAPATTEISLSDDINDTAAPTTDHERPVSGHGSIHTAGADRPTSLYSSGASGRSSPVVVEKRNSLTRSGHANRVSSLRSKFQRKESQEGSVSEQPEEKVPAAEPEGQRGVTLTDAPMDDDF
ncbi:hypothetical protein KEM55_002759 [Ascosphaera atra]|nr:hypothetical protein KEM55_002759 [Ascosphaera atra]